MRFAELSLERYGHFDGCTLRFRPGAPELHIIYGGNEAGKTTSLAAVSDLLFGFPARSPYNFLFDYALLRVGAVLEDGDRVLACRRKKGTSGTLVDSADAPIDEGPLLAMLRGQTRETFGLSFSLNQNGLRSGGLAMVEARNDLGRTLFAAGSGLTGISDALKRLEAEADAIWGPHAAARRTFTQAQRDFTERSKIAREASLKPKTWSDARAARDRAAAALESARQERDRVQAELAALERIRRLAPLVRRRAQEIESLRALGDIVDLGKAREDAAAAVFRDADEAERAKAAAETLLHDVAERKAAIAIDPAVLAEADAVDALVAEAGAVAKAARDLITREAELAATERTIAALRAEAGANADALPTRAIAARLRDLARLHAETRAQRAAAARSRATLHERRERALATLADTRAAALAPALVEAVDAARALGTDVDARCDEARRLAALAAETARVALDRLAPWGGTIEALRRLPRIGTDEIETARDDLAAITADIRRAEDEARRAQEDGAAVALEIAGTVAVAALSPDDIATAQSERAALWSPIKDHVLGERALAAPVETVAAFEAAMRLVDARMEQRFTHAEAWSRIAQLKRTKASNDLRAAQADARVAESMARRDAALDHWRARLAAAGLLVLDPLPFATWQRDRDGAEEAHRERDGLDASAERLAGDRERARRAVLTALRGAAGAGGGADLGPAGPDSQDQTDLAPVLAPVLARAERYRREGEAAAERRRLAHAEVERVEQDIAALESEARGTEAVATERAAAWTAALTEAGLTLDIETCGPVLDLLDDLRKETATAADQRHRIDGIKRDARQHVAHLDGIADRLGVPPGDPAGRLGALKSRLSDARGAARLVEALAAEGARRAGERDEAAARLAAAESALGPLFVETGAADRVALTEILERSRAKRMLVETLSETERAIVAGGDGFGLDVLLAAVSAADPDTLAGRVAALTADLAALNGEADAAASAHGEAKRAFADLEAGTTSAADAAADAAQARSELEVLAEHYILKRAEALTLKWAIEQYRERHQDPLLLRAGELFAILTLGRYASLRVDSDGPTPRLLGLRDDGRTLVDVQHMSEGTTDQLFLALRLSALEQSVKAGVALPFLADDLFVNFDDARAEAGFKVLAEVAESTQVLFFTHHPHLAEIARTVVGADLHSECALNAEQR
ncbi:YhaN family protein [Segnochrobactrum spirostomi]|uniref:AAA family ATPase n=1 Tax=Segnochrobactrum spirostomi TaxID=2608987 RepID=A0A6A7Y261_9HYPH|nr:YhaN family protein [Segnochrobactrum spirostomi]MQT12805.1 AAA family ATPase [Segnochrobactrum spirostomi]